MNSVIIIRISIIIVVIIIIIINGSMHVIGRVNGILIDFSNCSSTGRGFGFIGKSVFNLGIEFFSETERFTETTELG